MDITSEIKITEPIQFALEKVCDLPIKIILKKEKSIRAQGYKREAQGDVVTLYVSDDAGAMYGILDLKDSLEVGRDLTDQEFYPYLENRGVKFNIPLDARTPSYSDASTSALLNIPHMWEMDFWHAFLDQMAVNRYNVLSLWTLSPFPSLVKIPEFPEVSLEDVKVSTRSFHPKLSGDRIYDSDHRSRLITVKKVTIDEKIAFFQEVMAYAQARCIRVYLFTWNIFTFGTEHTNYGITPDQNNPITKSYYYCGVKALLETYPLLAGIGVTSGENMVYNGGAHEGVPFSQTDIGFIRETYGAGIEDHLRAHPERKLTLIHRMQMARYAEIMNAYADFAGDFEISFKYSNAHMYSHIAPPFIEEFLAEKDPSVHFWLTVRNDDYYFYRWGDPEYARRYLLNMPQDGLRGFYMGADGFTWGRDYTEKDGQERQLFTEKMWYMFSIWGKLSYNVELPDVDFQIALQHKLNLSQSQSEILYQALQAVSRIIPGVNRTHWHNYDFQWYPEGCCLYLNKGFDKIVFADIYEFMDCPAIPNREYLCVKEYAQMVYQGEDTLKISPVTVAEDIIKNAQKGLELILTTPFEGTSQECEKTLSDIEAMGFLGMYYGLKIKAAVELKLYCLKGDLVLKQSGVDKLKEAAKWFKRYAEKTAKVYVPQVLTRLCGFVDISRFIQDAESDILLAEEL